MILAMDLFCLFFSLPFILTIHPLIGKWRQKNHPLVTTLPNLEIDQIPYKRPNERSQSDHFVAWR